MELLEDNSNFENIFISNPLPIEYNLVYNEKQSSSLVDRKSDFKIDNDMVTKMYQKEIFSNNKLFYKKIDIVYCLIILLVIVIFIFLKNYNY